MSVFADETDDYVAELTSVQKRTNQLLADLVAAQGSTNLPEDTDNQPYGVITVPDDAQYYGLPAGQTQFRFGDGQIDHDIAGKLANIQSISGLSRELDSTTNQLRSLYIYVDAPATLTLDGANTRTLEAGQHYTFTDSGFTTATLESDYSLDVTLAAGTRRTNAQVGSSGAHSERKGSRNSGTYDTWEKMVLATPNVWANPDVTVTTSTGDTEWYVRPFEKETIQVVNGSSAANDIDVRIMAHDVRINGSGAMDDWYEIARQTNISQNARHKFVLNEPHHELRVEFQNSTDGNTVTAGCTTVGVN